MHTISDLGEYSFGTANRRGRHALSDPETLTTCPVVLASLSTACTTLRPIAVDVNGDSIRREVKPGDTVRVVTKGGAAHGFQVTVVGATSLSGNEVRTWKRGSDPVGPRIDVTYSDIAELDVKRTAGA